MKPQDIEEEVISRRHINKTGSVSLVWVPDKYLLTDVLAIIEERGIKNGSLAEKSSLSNPRPYEIKISVQDATEQFIEAVERSQNDQD